MGRLLLGMVFGALLLMLAGSNDGLFALRSLFGAMHEGAQMLLSVKNSIFGGQG